MGESKNLGESVKFGRVFVAFFDGTFSFEDALFGRFGGSGSRGVCAVKRAVSHGAVIVVYTVGQFAMAAVELRYGRFFAL